jgi:pimeloyl-ACP methyl ester carboxylesterase
MAASPSWSLTRPDGVEVGVHQLGNGPDVVLVHGTACDHRVWARVSRRLAANYTVHAIDRRGRGASGDGSAWSLTRDAGDVAAVAAELGTEVPVVGHSLGGIVALEAGLAGDAVGPIVAYEPPVHGEDRPPMEAADDLERQHREQGPEAAVEAFLGEVGYEEAQIDRLRKHEEIWQATLATADTLAREARADLAYEVDPDHLAGLTQPVLLLEGARGPADFEVGLDLLADALPDVQREAVPGATHAVLYEAPGRLADRLEALLAEHV